MSSKYVCAALLVCLCSSNASGVTVSAAGDQFSVGFNGIIDGAEQEGLAAFATFEVRSVNGNTFVFDVDLANTSSQPITASGLTAFGFATDPDVASGSTSGDIFDRVFLTNNTPQPNLTNIEVCVNAANGNNCSGQGNTTIPLGQSSELTLTLVLTEAPATLELTDFFVRYQSLEGQTGSDSAIGIGTVVPLPAAAWLFLSGLAGLFGVKRLKRA